MRCGGPNHIIVPNVEIGLSTGQRRITVPNSVKVSQSVAEIFNMAITTILDYGTLGGWFSHLWADCLYTGICSKPNARKEYEKTTFYTMHNKPYLKTAVDIQAIGELFKQKYAIL